MKEMSKAKIIDKKSVTSVKNERDFLSKMNHPFIVNMHYAFQDNNNLYLVMDLLTGGDLRYQLCKRRKFTEEQTKYIMACIILSLEYIHTNKIIHRDIKPENLVLDHKGNVHLTDFGIAKFQHVNNAKDTSGTPGYMSPEVMCGLDHSIAVDYFALGVIGYEFMKGVRPYLGNSRKEIKEKIMAKQAMIKSNECTNGWSPEAIDCINRLLLRKPCKRLGYNGAKEVKHHHWFKGFNWKELYMGKLNAPFVPKEEDNYDYTYCNAIDKITLKTKERYSEIMHKENYKILFEDYSYYSREEKRKENEERFINPHLKYEIEYDLEVEKESRRMSGDDMDAPMFRRKRNIESNMIKSKSYVKGSLYNRYMNNSSNVSYVENNNNVVYYKNNKSTLNKTNVHQRNFSSNSTNLNSIK